VSKSGGSRAERAYLELVREYERAILNYLFRLVGDRDTAEDLTQETYLRAYRALERMELGDSSAGRRRAWLYRIAHNAATDHLRRTALLSWLPLDVLHRGESSARVEDPATADAASEPVHRALARLSRDHREVLILFSHDELDTEEVAEVLRISPEAARKRRQRARDAFREAYDAERREGGSK
jgi:RNA polymerase sigma-70 factor (ECF subfamily)